MNRRCQNQKVLFSAADFLTLFTEHFWVTEAFWTCVCWWIFRKLHYLFNEFVRCEGNFLPGKKVLWRSVKRSSSSAVYLAHTILANEATWKGPVSDRKLHLQKQKLEYAAFHELHLQWGGELNRFGPQNYHQAFRISSSSSLSWTSIGTLTWKMTLQGLGTVPHFTVHWISFSRWYRQKSYKQ